MDVTENLFVCNDCIKDIYLKHYVKTHSRIEQSCTICLGKKIVVDINKDSEIVQFARFLVRYHYPEYEYNPHWGGDDLPKQFYLENPIISHNFKNYNQREFEIEDFLHILFGLWRSDVYESLYYGHDEWGRGMYPNAIKDEKSKIWKEYRNKLQSQNYFTLESDAKMVFNNLLEDLKFILPANSPYFRARIGYAEKEEDLGFSKVTVKIPYDSKNLSAPPVYKARAGRANRQGVSFLYLASDKNTALGEVRPHPGHYVSTGEFVSQKNLQLADLRFINLYNYFTDNDKLEVFKMLRDLSDDLSMPVLPEEQGNYLITQFITDILRQLGFEGIMFNSSVSKGHNAVIFNPENFAFKFDSAQLDRIMAIDFSYKKTEFDLDNFLGRSTEK